MKTLAALFLLTTVAFAQEPPPPPAVALWSGFKLSNNKKPVWDIWVEILMQPPNPVSRQYACSSDGCLLSLTYVFPDVNDLDVLLIDKGIYSMETFYNNEGKAINHWICSYNRGSIASCRVWETGKVLYKVKNEDGTWSIAKDNFKQ